MIVPTRANILPFHSLHLAGLQLHPTPFFPLTRNRSWDSLTRMSTEAEVNLSCMVVSLNWTQYMTRSSVVSSPHSRLFKVVFLVVDTQLYKRLCPMIRLSVYPYSVEKNSGIYIWGGVGSPTGVWNCGWELDAPAHPSATIL